MSKKNKKQNKDMSQIQSKKNDESLFIQHEDSLISYLPSSNEETTKQIMKKYQTNIQQQQRIIEKQQSMSCDNSQELTIRFVGTVDVCLGIEKFQRVDSFTASYQCDECIGCSFDNKSEYIQCQCGQYKLNYQAGGFVPVLKEKTNKTADQLLDSDYSVLCEIRATLFGKINFNTIKLKVVCKKCANVSDQYLDFQQYNGSLNKSEIQQIHFNFQGMCNKCCSVQYFSFTNTMVKYSSNILDLQANRKV